MFSFTPEWKTKWSTFEGEAIRDSCFADAEVFSGQRKLIVREDKKSIADSFISKSEVPNVRAWRSHIRERRGLHALMSFHMRVRKTYDNRNEQKKYEDHNERREEIFLNLNLYTEKI